MKVVFPNGHRNINERTFSELKLGEVFMNSPYEELKAYRIKISKTEAFSVVVHDIKKIPEDQPVINYDASIVIDGRKV